MTDTGDSSTNRSIVEKPELLDTFVRRLRDLKEEDVVD
jgi:hypothetical protein